MKVAAVQHDIVWEDPAANFTRLEPLVQRAAAAGADLVALTETYSTGFTMNTDRLGEPPDGPSARFLRDMAARYGVWTVATVLERGPDDVRPRNQLLLVAPSGEIAGRYTKRHPFRFGGEHEHYARGTDPLTVEVLGVRVSFAVCFDLRFAPDFWAQASATDAYMIVANWPEERRQHWQPLLQARAIENQAFVVGVNRVGTGGNGLRYLGDSAVFDPLGNLVAGAGSAEVTLLADIDAAEAHDVRSRFPFLESRRLDASGDERTIETGAVETGA